jgi:hypothetical protein
MAEVSQLIPRVIVGRASSGMDIQKEKASVSIPMGTATKVMQSKKKGTAKAPTLGVQDHSREMCMRESGRMEKCTAKAPTLALQDQTRELCMRESGRNHNNMVTGSNIRQREMCFSWTGTKDILNPAYIMAEVPISTTKIIP